jgi:hypothetical protein
MPKRLTPISVQPQFREQASTPTYKHRSDAHARGLRLSRCPDAHRPITLGTYFIASMLGACDVYVVEAALVGGFKCLLSRDDKPSRRTGGASVRNRTGVAIHLFLHPTVESHREGGVRCVGMALVLIYQQAPDTAGPFIPPKRHRLRLGSSATGLQRELEFRAALSRDRKVSARPRHRGLPTAAFSV